MKIASRLWTGLAIAFLVTATPTHAIDVRPRVVDGALGLAWSGATGPFRLEMASDPVAGPWWHVVSTHRSELILPIAESAQFFRVSSLPVATSTVDYSRDRSAMAAFYNQNPSGYWAQFGIPPLTRLAQVLEGGGASPAEAFGDLQPAFQPQVLQQALSQNQLPPPVAERLQQALRMGAPLWDATLGTFSSLIRDWDQIRETQGSEHPSLAQITQQVQVLFDRAFAIPNLQHLAPVAQKEVLPGQQPLPGIDDLHGTSDYADVSVNRHLTGLTKEPVVLNGAPAVLSHYQFRIVEFTGKTARFRTEAITLTNVPDNAPPPNPADGELAPLTPWPAITNSWPTTHDGACATLATGLSAWKLGLLPYLVNCQLWNQISHELGAVPGVAGATGDGQAAWYGARGLSCTKAVDTADQSAVAEADAALARGCDVRIRYVSRDGSQAHTEFVTSIDRVPNSTTQWRVRTISWGQLANVTVGPAGFRDKSDGPRYGAGGFLNGEGIAEFYYYCRK